MKKSQKRRVMGGGQIVDGRTNQFLSLELFGRSTFWPLKVVGIWGLGLLLVADWTLTNNQLPTTSNGQKGYY
ncbi:hypothetical protein BpHYR1_007608 [Brachionus plicatilis]|uniref:Uncharacterized protein n=1 Tax=Brachionus plicatilis TaxID=10195 RepID=A0A3M7S0C9_BRAPC|nr:hypothetical protein BpHYR1_007608 [Brachionus plicatilis]